MKTSFWSQFRGNSASGTIEELVSHGDECCLEAVLEEDELLDDCRNQSSNLVKWISHRNRVRQLVDMITVMPETDQHKRGHKYPFIVSEIFSCEIPEIINMFFIEEKEDEEDEEDKDDKDGQEGEEEEKEDEKEEEDKDEEEKDEEEKDEEDKEEDDKEETKDEDQEGDKEEVEDKKEIKEKEDEKNEEDQENEKEEENEKENKGEIKEENGQDNEGIKEETKEETHEETNEETHQETKEEINEETKEENDEETKEENDEEDNEQQEDDDAQVISEGKVKKQQQEDNEDNENEEQPKVINNVWTVTEQVENEQTEDSINTESKEQIKEPSDLLNYLFSFLDSEEEINPVLCGYFSKLVNQLLTKRHKDLMEYIYERNPQIIDKYINHIYSKSLIENLIRILNIEETYDSQNSPIEQKQKARNFKQIRQNALLNITQSLSSDYSEESNLNSAQILIDLSDYKQVANNLFHSDILNKVFELAHSTNTQQLKSVLEILLHLLKVYLKRKRTDDSDDEEKTYQESQIETLLVEQGDEIFIHLIAHNEQDDSDDEDGLINTQYGTRIKPYGIHRLHVVDLVNESLKLGNQQLNEVMKECGVFHYLLKMVKLYEWNGMLHYKTDQVFKTLFDQCAQDIIPVVQMKDILHGCRLAERLIELQKNSNYEMFGPTKSPFQVIVTSLANIMTSEKMSGNEALQEHLEEIQEDWDYFLETDLASINEINNTALAGHERVSENPKDEFDKYEMQMEKLFEQFSQYKKIHDEEQQREQEQEEREEAEKLRLIEEKNKSNNNEIQTNLKDDDEEEGYYDNSFWSNTETYSIEQLLGNQF